MRKVTKTKFLAFALCAALVVVFGQGAALATVSCEECISSCIFNLPEPCTDPKDPATTVVGTLIANERELTCENMLNANSYFDTELDLPDGFTIVDGTFDGWCIDLDAIVPFPFKSRVNLFSSLESPTEPDLNIDISPEQWQQINCIINNDAVGANWLDVQAAIWTIVTGGEPEPGSGYPSDFPFGKFTAGSGGCPNPDNGGLAPDQDKVAALVAQSESQECADFIPDAGDPVAIAVQPLKDDCVNSDNQLSIIEADCCQFIKKFVSVTGEKGPFFDADCCGDADTPVVGDPADVFYKICVTNCEGKTLENVIISDPVLDFKQELGPLYPDDPTECFTTFSDEFPCGADDDDSSSSVNIATAVGYFDHDDDDATASSATTDKDCAWVLCGPDAICEDDDH
jgi:hypothetical protein